jgi:hypothetical protein
MLLHGKSGQVRVDPSASAVILSLLVSVPVDMESQ